MTADVRAALRLGWSVSEVRGRNWPKGPRPEFTPLPAVPGAEVLPLRSQRDLEASRKESAESLAKLVRSFDLPDADQHEVGLRSAIAPFDGGPGSTPSWSATASFFSTLDSDIQDHLARRSEKLANAYLLGRGLAECYWGMGPRDAWGGDGEQATGVSPAFLLGEDRQRELTRMLGRLEPGETHALSASAIAGTLEAWEAVATHERWRQHEKLEVLLYEQVRRWYQLLVLHQDPTTLVRPGERLPRLVTALRSLKAFWPQVVVTLAVLGLGPWLVRQLVDDPGVLSSTLAATGGVGAVVVATLLAKGQSAAQRVVMRMRQDAYTDLVVLSLTAVPDAPSWWDGIKLDRAVRTRRLTPPTPPPYTAA